MIKKTSKMKIKKVIWIKITFTIVFLIHKDQSNVKKV